ncbi:MAG: methyl-accepting chemotaxis protein [Syntrophorhabdales bacterium]
MRISDLRIATRLKIPFAVMTGIIVVGSIVGFKNMHDIDSKLEEIANRGFEKTMVANRIINSVNGAYASLGVIASFQEKDEVDEARRNIDEQRKSYGTCLETLERLEGTPKGREMISRFKEAMSEAHKTSKRVVALAGTGQSEAALKLYLDEAKPESSRITDIMKELIDYESRQVKAALKEMRDANNSVRVCVSIFNLFFVGICVCASYFTRRSIVPPLYKAVYVANKLSEGELTVDVETERKDEVGELMKAMHNMVTEWRNVITRVQTASRQVAASAGRLRGDAEETCREYSEQAGRTSQVASSAQEMSQTVLDIAKNANDIASSATQTAHIAKEGKDVVDASMDEVKKIAHTVDQSAGFVRILGEQSNHIGDIVTVINDIADQTNLLALNAAIEAARAGEQGRGFSVVADEVRKLAERTADATSKIGSMIHSIQKGVSQAVNSMEEATDRVTAGVKLCTRAGESLEGIVRSANGLQLMVQQIASATEEMTATSDSIADDIEHVAAISGKAATTSEQTMAAGTELADLSADLQLTIGTFRL